MGHRAPLSAALLAQAADADLDPRERPTGPDWAQAALAAFKAELVRNRGPWRNLDEVEIAVAEYVDWFNHRRLHGEIGLVPPAEFEDGFYRHLSGSTEGEALVPSLQ
ncbi:IS3 family transposase [Nocardiopsis exhalans]|uniref:IS3 family transposase n=1 Tax=Nocardiopsis exhalans TaxID=163604 RepID=A0ABY5DBP3_9ACTN|nr:IS3 family transposase [Nocardiopsis exhalans]USY20450.1 IS3 family transposase [Nocardiopsis exhalans]